LLTPACGSDYLWSLLFQRQSLYVLNTPMIFILRVLILTLCFGFVTWYDDKKNICSPLHQVTDIQRHLIDLCTIKLLNLP
jgi:UDP-N-acetylmuramyl pentapeptide phosphotransferase/UDP-N-acetylglucosamine-1-phosphate transferase